MMNNVQQPKFQPTVHSDYFFNEPPSPLPHSIMHDIHPNSSPEIESPNSGSTHAFKKSDVSEAIPEDDADRDVTMESDDALPFEPIQMPSPYQTPMTLDIGNPPTVHTRVVPMDDVKLAQTNELVTSMMPAVPGIGSPTRVVSSQFSVAPASSSPTSHCQRVHQNLIAAAMSLPPPVHPNSNNTRPPPLLPQDRKNSTSMAGTASASSTAPNSNSNSPMSPGSDTQMSTSVSASHTPSPPPLQLPQAVQVMQPQNLTPLQTPQSTPTRHRTANTSSVPAAASHIAPLMVPSHHDVTNDRAPYHQANTQHAQTPHQPSRHHHHDHHNSAHSNPATPPAQPQSTRHARKQSGGGAFGTPEGNVEYVGPFILGPVLGRGCTGTVRLGTHKRNKFECAFKIIEKKTLEGNGSEEGRKLWTKVKREIVILKLIEHPHVLKLYDVLETENRLYLVLERVKGGELFDYIVSKGRLDRHESLRITAQIVMGLEHCHAHNMSVHTQQCDDGALALRCSFSCFSFFSCHRDLKPENLRQCNNSL